MARRAHLPITGTDTIKEDFGYSIEVGSPPQSDFVEPPRPERKSKGLKHFIKWALIRSGVYKNSWTTSEIEVTDRWNDWFFRNRKYVLFSVFALFITCLVMTVLYINLFGPGKRVSIVDLKYKVKTLDLENQKFQRWLKTVDWIEIKKSDLESGIITAPLFLNWGPINVTAGDLRGLLETNCPLEEKECLCLSVFHLGFAANSIILNDFDEDASLFLIEPKVTAQTSQMVRIRVGESKDPIETPASITIEYLLESGLKTRRSLKNEQAACILECLKKMAK